MADDLKEIRDCYQQDLDEWAEARTERAKDMRYRAGDPWKQEEKDARTEAGRPFITVDELSQYTNQIINDMRVNPLSVNFAPGPPITAGQEQIIATEEAASVYSDKWREIEYRSNAHELYAMAFENCIDGSYGYARLVSEYSPRSFEQELRIKAVPDPNTIIPDPKFQMPDLSDMKRCFVLEKRPIAEFRRKFPKATIQSFEGYQHDNEYRSWLGEKDVLLAEYWTVEEKPIKLLLVQPPAAVPPSGSFGFRPPASPPPVTITVEMLARMPQGSTVLREREEFEPAVTQKLVNGVEILSETTWPGPYIPIAGCMGRILYLDEGGTTKRHILSAIRLARDPFMAYCFYRTCELEAVGQITKNPYWAYEGQVSPEMQTEIAKSLHEPVALLTAKATVEGLPGQVLPLPIRNPQSADLAGFSIGAEEMRRAVQAAMGGSFLPSAAQKQNEKSKVALEYIGQSAARGTFHFFDHYKAMRRHLAACGEAALDKFYDTKRQIMVRRANDKSELIWVNDPANPEAVDLRGSFTVDISDGQNVDSTRQAASDFADMLLGSEALMTLIGPEKAQQIAALAVKLKVKQTGIGPIGQEIIDIIAPPPDEKMSPEQVQAQNAQLKQQVQQAQQMLEQMKQDIDSGLSKEREKTQRDVFLSQMEQKFEAFLQTMKGTQALQLQAAKDAGALAKQDDAQRHEVGIAGADAAVAKETADKALLASMAQPEAGGSNGTGASA
ncbi:MAG: hypothetical protein A3E01_18450 [Gammaproteobacteria bacterium RIFCSPHIGHO2_12_FULL_63_22]|nr:MAG: hypothetical protein A3E01_18450 [Gammaproteobacteria bacterium RIFCSPHIGHO2_12_FULL_63_22]